MAPDDDSLRERFEAMRAAHAADPLPGWPERERRLRALETLVREHRGDIAAAIHADFGHRPAQETDLLEVFPSLSGIRLALRHGRRMQAIHNRLRTCAMRRAVGLRAGVGWWCVTTSSAYTMRQPRAARSMPSNSSSAPRNSRGS